jgi:Fur family transcriptional regulator, zinc uptake regulator
MAGMIRHKAVSFPARDHDHGLCVQDALGRARTRCLELEIKWTALREQVFRHVAQSHKPVSAYDLIESLAKEGKRLAPVSVYRILDVFQGAGLVHRLESRNAFFACMTEHASAPQTITLVCEGCERVIEADAPDAFRAIGTATQTSGFRARNVVIEVGGTCADCDEGSKRGGSC